VTGGVWRPAIQGWIKQVQVPSRIPSPAQQIPPLRFGAAQKQEVIFVPEGMHARELSALTWNKASPNTSEPILAQEGSAAGL